MSMAKQHPDWAIGFQDESWWSRLTHPALHSWTIGEPLHLIEHSPSKEDPEPKAIACYGLDIRWQAADAVWLRFVEGNPRSDPTIQFLDWTLKQMASQGIRVLVMFWDHASWHKSQKVKAWIRQHNRRVKASGKGIRLLAVLLPKKSPWLNPIEPRWIHAKRKVVSPEEKLSVAELSRRIYSVFNQPTLPWLIPNNSP
jgi:transposase